VKLYLVRHAPAGDRYDWKGPDHERPLSKKGHRVAEALAEALSAEPIERILSSPAVRCVQTVEPLAARLGLEIESLPELGEGARLPKARALLDSLVESGTCTVVSGHGDLIPELLQDLEREGTTVHGWGCAKGSVWELVAEGGRVVRALYHGRPGEPEFRIGVA
jgi:8-oxo-dGTP diphosphatase